MPGVRRTRTHGTLIVRPPDASPVNVQPIRAAGIVVFLALLLGLPRLDAVAAPCGTDTDRATCEADPGECPCPSYGLCGMGSCFIDTERVAAQRAYRAGMLALGDARYDEAVTELASALPSLARSPRDVRADRAAVEDALTFALVMTERYAEALDHGLEAVRLHREIHLASSPERAAAERLLGDVLRRLGRPAEAMAFYRAYHAFAVARGETEAIAAGFNKIGLSLDDLGRYPEAIASYESALAALGPGDAATPGQVIPIQANLASVYSRMGRPEEAYRLHTAARDRLVAAFGETSPLVATIEHNRAVCLDRLGRLEEAVDRYRASLAIAGLHPRQRASAAATRSWLGVALAQLGDYEAGESECRRAHAELTAIHGETHPAVATSWNHLAWLAQYFSRHDEALNAYMRFLAITRTVMPADHPDLAVAINNVGSAYGYLGRSAEARAAYEEAIRIERVAHGESYPGLAIGYQNLAELHMRDGERESALILYRRALTHRLASSGDRHPQVSSLWMAIANCHLQVSDTPAWVEAIERAVAATRRGEAPWDGSASSLRSEPSSLVNLSYLAWARHADGRRDTRTRYREAVAIFDTAAALMTRLRVRLSGGSRERTDRGVAEMFTWSLALCRDLAAIDPGADRSAAVRNIEMVSAWSLLEQIATSRAEGLLDADPALVREHQALERRLETLRLTEQTAGVLAEARGLEAEADRVRERIRREAPRYAALHMPRPATVEDVTSALRGDEVAVSFVKGRYGAFAVAVTRESMVLVDLGDPVELETALQSARAAMVAVEATTRGRRSIRAGAPRGIRTSSPASRGGAPVAVARSAADSAANVDPLRELDRRLLAPLDPVIRGKRIILVPGPAFEGIAFGALKTAAGRWRLDEHEIVYAPSLAVFALLRDLAKHREPAVAGRPLLALGDPVYRGRPDPAAARAMTRYGSERGTWGALPASGAEVRAIANLFPPDSRLVLTGRAAVEARLDVESWTRVPYLHFACHGALEEGPGREPALVLALTGNEAPYDGFLTLSEIAARRIEAELVVLSACNSGRSAASRPPSGVSSLSRAFLLAGARNVVVSLWPVSDQATARLMVEFYKRMRREGLEPSSALRAASIALRDDLGMSSPAHWAPFIVQGAL